MQYSTHADATFDRTGVWRNTRLMTFGAISDERHCRDDSPDRRIRFHVPTPNRPIPTQPDIQPPVIPPEVPQPGDLPPSDTPTPSIDDPPPVEVPQPIQEPPQPGLPPEVVRGAERRSQG